MASVEVAQQQIRERVPAFAIPQVDGSRHSGIFGDLHDVIAVRKQNALQRRRADLERLFERLRRDVSADDYADLQSRHIQSDTNHPQGYLKYLDACHWIASKYARAIAHLGLDKSRCLRILDLGCGPGHAVWVFRQMGHQALGMDMRPEQAEFPERIALFDDLCGLLRVERVLGRINAFESLPPLSSRFDLVTVFMGTFSLLPDEQPWPLDAWRFFLADIFDNVLTRDGVLYLNMAREAVSASVWEYLASRADLVFAATCTVRLRNSDQ